MSSYRLRAVGYMAATIALATIFAAVTKTQSSFRKPLTGTVGSKRRTPPPPIAADKGIGASREIAETFGKLPLAFEANQGQIDRRVKFLSRGSGYTLFLIGDEAVLALKKSGQRSTGSQRTAGVPLSPYETISSSSKDSIAPTYIRMKLVGANPKPAVSGTDELPGKSNYFIGNDPRKWHTNVPSYAKVKYQQVYTGVDLVYYGNQQQLEYDFVVAPGTDPRAIQFGFDGAEKLSIDEQGALLLKSKGRDLLFEPPQLYQELAGERQKVEGRYSLVAEN